MELQFIQDLGHAWLKVPMKLINELGIRRKITKYSYKKDNDAYLEEDVDAALFMVAYEERHGESITFDIVSHGENSPIRNYEPFTIA